MPGVPTGRGCDACRRQKKKCDEAKPACSLCTRRGIECVGAGERRYKFKEEYGRNVARKSAPRRPVKQERDASSCYSRGVTAVPNNTVTLLAQALVCAISPETDLRYNLMWAYGGYLNQVPARLGTNEALDATVDALVTAHATFSSRKEVTVASLVKYSRALNALRNYLDNPHQAGNSETLCAVSLLLLVQNLIGPADQQWSGHAEGAVKILKARRSCAPQNDFERNLLLSLRGPVLFEGLFNPNIDLTSDEWSDLVENELDSSTPEGLLLQCLARMPDILRRARNNREGPVGIQSLQTEIKALYITVRNVCDQFRERLVEFETPGAGSGIKLSPGMLHAHYQRTYGLSLIIALYMNYVLVMMQTPDNTLKPDATYLAAEMLDVAENAVIYRPFGSGYVPAGLMAAWVAVDEQPLRSLIESSLLDYKQDFNHHHMDPAYLREKFIHLHPLEPLDPPEAWHESVEHEMYEPL